MKIGPLVRTLRAGDVRARMAAFRAGNATTRVAVIGSGLRTGALADLAAEPLTTDQLADRHGWSDRDRVEAYLRVLASHGLLEDDGGRWRATKRARRLLADDVASAAYDAFSGYHTDLYRGMDGLLRGADREDITRDGALIARLSRFMDQFVTAELDRAVDDQEPQRLLDVGCGAASHLVHLLGRVPDALALGVETDADAAALARTAVAQAGVGDRAEILQADLDTLLTTRPDERFDLVWMANVVYYVPKAERVTLFRDLASRLSPGGRVVLVTTGLTDETFSRHFDLLLRAQPGALELPDMDELSGQLGEAGLTTDPVRRIAPGEPLMAVTARLPG